VRIGSVLIAQEAFDLVDKAFTVSEPIGLLVESAFEFGDVVDGFIVFGDEIRDLVFVRSSCESEFGGVDLNIEETSGALHESESCLRRRSGRNIGRDCSPECG
jgi:hypothetical protein